MLRSVSTTPLTRPADRPKKRIKQGGSTFAKAATSPAPRLPSRPDPNASATASSVQAAVAKPQSARTPEARPRLEASETTPNNGGRQMPPTEVTVFLASKKTPRGEGKGKKSQSHRFFSSSFRPRKDAVCKKIKERKKKMKNPIPPRGQSPRN